MAAPKLQLFFAARNGVTQIKNEESAEAAVKGLTRPTYMCGCAVGKGRSSGDSRIYLYLANQLRSGDGTQRSACPTKDVAATGPRPAWSEG